jgi:uncharacterized membrane-anchored protein YjiN (DUF445 family)
MTRRRKSTRAGDINPDSHVTMSLQQVLVVASILLACGSGYAYLVWNQSDAKTAIADVNTKLSTVTVNNGKALADEDSKREQMGKDFLASTEKIADKVSDLNTALAVQQTTSKQMADTLQTISNQLGELAKVAAPTPVGAHK